VAAAATADSMSCGTPLICTILFYIFNYFSAFVVFVLACLSLFATNKLEEDLVCCCCCCSDDIDREMHTADDDA
jgi:hypothetical protein